MVKELQSKERLYIYPILRIQKLESCLDQTSRKLRYQKLDKLSIRSFLDPTPSQV